jgi:hypothetical protein
MIEVEAEGFFFSPVNAHTMSEIATNIPTGAATK